MTVFVNTPHAILDSAWVTSSSIVHSGENLAVGVQISNRGLSDFRQGKLHFYWKNFSGSLIQSVPDLAPGQSRTVIQNITFPSPLSAFEKAVLCIELWKDGYRYAVKELMMVGGQPISPVLAYDNRYPFTTAPATYQETFFYFDKPAFLGRGGRLLNVEIPIICAESDITLNDFYIEVCTRAELLELPKKTIERIPLGKAVSGTFAIRNGKVILPLEPYDYSPYERDLVLRIRNRNNQNLGEYFLQAHKQRYTSTLVRTEHSGGRLDSIRSRSIPLLQFQTAVESAFYITVVDEQNMPCTGAEVTIYGSQYTTDASGTVNISSLWEGNYGVTVFSASHGLQTFQLALRKETAYYTLQLHKPQKIYVTFILTDHWGKRINDALLRVENKDYYTQSDGTAVIQVHEGLREFYLYADGYEEKTTKLRISNEEKQYVISLHKRDLESKFDVRCIPNLVHNEFSLTSPSIMSLIRIYSVDGVLLQEYNVHAYHFIGNLAYLPRGLYIIEVHGNEPEKLARIRIVKDR